MMEPENERINTTVTVYPSWTDRLRMIVGRPMFVRVVTHVSVPSVGAVRVETEAWADPIFNGRSKDGGAMECPATSGPNVPHDPRCAVPMGPP